MKFKLVSKVIEIEFAFSPQQRMSFDWQANVAHINYLQGGEKIIAGESFR